MEFSINTRVYLEDTDAQGIVYYVNYLKFMERARTEMLRSFGFDFQHLLLQSGHFVVHSLDVRYLRSARVDDEIQVSADIVKTARTYVVFSQEVKLKMSGEVLCAGQVKVACVNSQTGRPMSIPEAIAAAFQKRTIKNA